MTQVLIDGTWGRAHGGEQRMVENPATLQPVAAAPVCDARDRGAAEAAAHRALEGWHSRAPAERQAFLREMGRSLAESAAEIAQLQALESGQAVRECLDAARAAAKCFAHAPREESVSTGVHTLTLNAMYPLLHWAFAAPALLCQGATLVCLVPFEMPLAVLRAARCAAALPAGVMNVIVGSAETAASIKSDLSACPRDVVYVHRTFDRDLLEPGAASLRLYHSGQRPGQSARVYVDQQVSAAVADALHQTLAFLECGDPRKAITDLGPLRSSAALEKAQDQVAEALRRGALLKLGGRRYQPWGLQGYFFQPTLLIEGPDAESLADEEIGAPVLIISPVRNLAHALLQQTGTAARAVIFARELEASLQPLTAAGIDFELGSLTPPLEQIAQHFTGAPVNRLRIEPVTARQPTWFPYRARVSDG